jgi:hypothetical protein
VKRNVPARSIQEQELGGEPHFYQLEPARRVAHAN